MNKDKIIQIKNTMIAPCGMNCAICLSQFRLPKTCDGCNTDGQNKPKYCSKCIIKNCKIRLENNYKYCFQCNIYPCTRLKQLDKRYRTKYGMSMLENLQNIKEKGIRKHIENEKIKWTCSECGKILCVHRKYCLYCDKQRKSNTKPTMNENIQKELKRLRNKEYAARLQKYFKTGKGEYGEGDKFLGIQVPVLRKIAKKYRKIPVGEISVLIKSQFHEERLLSLFVLVDIFKRANDKIRKKIYTAYLSYTKFINNWDLVDSSAGHIVGAYLLTRDKKPIYLLARSKNIWERRISIMSTSYFIGYDKFVDALKIAGILLGDKEDLIHKAVGWMLREIGKRDLELEERFLVKYYKSMPRTMLRYAIEKFPEEKRKSYLKGEL